MKSLIDNEAVRFGLERTSYIHILCSDLDLSMLFWVDVLQLGGWLAVHTLASTLSGLFIT